MTFSGLWFPAASKYKNIRHLSGCTGIIFLIPLEYHSNALTLRTWNVMMTFFERWMFRSLFDSKNFGINLCEILNNSMRVCFSLETRLKSTTWKAFRAKFSLFNKQYIVLSIVNDMRAFVYVWWWFRWQCWEWNWMRNFEVGGTEKVRKMWKQTTVWMCDMGKKT